MSNVGSSSDDDDLFAAAAEVAKAKQAENQGTSTSDLPIEIQQVLSHMQSKLPNGFKIAGIMVGGDDGNFSDIPLNLGAQQSKGTASDHLYSTYSSYMSNIDTCNMYGPAMRAMYQVLDEMSGGRVTYLTRLYEGERHILHTHRAIKSLNNILEEAKVEVDHLPESFMATAEFLMRFMQQRLEYYVARYREFAAQYQVTPDEAIIANGVPNYETDSFDHLATVEMLEKLFD